MATDCERVAADPAKIKAWIDATRGANTVNVCAIAIQGETAIVFIEHS